MEKLESEDIEHLCVKVEREFRNVAPQEDLTVVWEIGEAGELDLKVRAGDRNSDEEAVTVIEKLLNECDERGLNLKHAINKLGLDNSVDGKQQAYQTAVRLGYKVTKKKYPNGVGYIIHPEDRYSTDGRQDDTEKVT
jgi:hypothetical protein